MKNIRFFTFHFEIKQAGETVPLEKELPTDATEIMGVQFFSRENPARLTIDAYEVEGKSDKITKGTSFGIFQTLDAGFHDDFAATVGSRAKVSIYLRDETPEAEFMPYKAQIVFKIS